MEINMKRQKLIILAILMSSICFTWGINSTWAENNQRLSQITFTLNADQWVVSNSADVTVAVHALLTQKQLMDAQKNILQALQKISMQGDWKIIQLQRTKNQANLEQLEILAQARLPNADLPEIRNRVKQQSKQGENYELQSIDYTPTPAEMETAEANLRTKIYEQAKAELKRINELYPEQHYDLFMINFNDIQPVQSGYQKVMMIESVNTPQPAAPTVAATANVSQHITLSAQVTLSHSLSNE